MKFVYIAILSMLFLGCASMMPGGLDERVSAYDGSKEIFMRPAHAESSVGTVLRIGFMKTNKMEKSDVQMLVVNNFIRNFDQGANFRLMIDGKEHAYTPIINKTECEASSSSSPAACSQTYLIKIETLHAIIKAKDVRFKLNLRDAAVNEGTINGKGISQLRPSLEKFLEKIEDKKPI